MTSDATPGAKRKSKARKYRAGKASSPTILRDYQKRAARAFSVPRLGLDHSLILEAALTTGASPSRIASHLQLPIAQVEDVLLASLLKLGNTLDLRTDAQAD